MQHCPRTRGPRGIDGRFGGRLLVGAALSLLACAEPTAAGDARPADAAAADAGPPDARLPATDALADEAAAFFAAANLPEIELVLSDAALDALAAAPCAYQRGTLKVGDTVLEQVGIRLKGMGSFRDVAHKASFKVKTDEFVAGQRLFGLRRLTLNNLIQDPTFVRERLGYRFMRAVGLPAPRCNNARLTVNGEYWGVYANVESIDDEFVESRFGTAAGNLYDTSSTTYFVDLLPGSEPGFERETNREAPDRSDLASLIAAANEPGGSFVDRIAEVLDLDELLRLGAAQAILADWDGYFGARNNYKLYHDLASDRFVILPWGIDQTFGGSDVAPTPLGARYDIFGSDSHRYNGWLFVRCKRDPSCLARYRAAVAAALATWESLPLEAELDAMVAQIDRAVDDDPRREIAVVEFDSRVAELRAFLRQRAEQVRTQLDGAARELCDNQIDDDGDGEVDCEDADCAPRNRVPFQALCIGQDDSCAGDPAPQVAPDSIAVTGALYSWPDFEPLPNVAVEALAAQDGAVLAATASGANGRFTLQLATGGRPMELFLRESLPGRVAVRRFLPSLARDLNLPLEVLATTAQLDDIARAAGLARDPLAGMVALETVDCAGARVFHPAIELSPAPKKQDAAVFFGFALRFNAEPGARQATATFEWRTFGPALVPTPTDGEITLIRLTPGP